MKNEKFEKLDITKKERLLIKLVNELRRLKKYKGNPDFDERYNNLKKKIIEENKSEALTIEVLFGIKDLIEAGEFLKKHRGQKIEKRKLREVMRTLTEWQFMATHLIIYAGKDRKFCEEFWSKYGEIYHLFSSDKPKGYKKGIIGQVAVYKIMKELGLNKR